ncbi:MAG: transcriptional regulator [Proteobacteria bacterium ST_bin13]|nr:MAG: transcriptional regulator [Proteobacteria bacterium ST_bin13]
MPANTILIVEDESLIAMMLEDFLELLGKQVIGPVDSVADGLAAVAAGGIGAAILDVNLRGGETSWPIADALAAAGIPFVVASGGGGQDIAERFRDRPLLSKPFTMDDVEAAIAQFA